MEDYVYRKKVEFCQMRVRLEELENGDYTDSALEKVFELDSPAGMTLFSALAGQKIFLPSACGGGGSCGTCKCVVTSGGQDLLPTELPHLTRKEQKENLRLACQVKVKQDMEIQIPDEIFNIKKYTARVVSNRNVATFIKELVLELEKKQRLDFKAGAYIQIDIPEYEADFTDFAVEQQYKPAWDQFNLWGASRQI